MYSMVHTLLFIGILLPLATTQLTQPLDQAEIRIVPANPTPNDTVSAQLSGTWHDGCIPRGAQVSVNKQVIRVVLQFPPSDTICMQALTQWSLTASIGRLAAGEFNVEIVRETGSSTITMGRKSFTVSSYLR